MALDHGLKKCGDILKLSVPYGTSLQSEKPKPVMDDPDSNNPNVEQCVLEGLAEHGECMLACNNRYE